MYLSETARKEIRAAWEQGHPLTDIAGIYGADYNSLWYQTTKWTRERKAQGATAPPPPPPPAPVAAPLDVPTFSLPYTVPAGEIQDGVLHSPTSGEAEIVQFVEVPGSDRHVLFVSLETYRYLEELCAIWAEGDGTFTPASLIDDMVFVEVWRRIHALPEEQQLAEAKRWRAISHGTAPRTVGKNGGDISEK